MKQNWPFDQDKDVAAITTVNVIENNKPILVVVHYNDDHSWGFLCGLTNEEEDARVVSMGEIVDLDSSVIDIANLPPGWKAIRENKEANWQQEINE